MRQGLTFDVAYMSLQVAIDGLGVALGYGPYVEADIAAGRLVAPFDLWRPSAPGFDGYVASPQATATTPSVCVFREWLLRQAASVAMVPRGYPVFADWG